AALVGGRTGVEHRRIAVCQRGIQVGERCEVVLAEGFAPVSEQFLMFSDLKRAEIAPGFAPVSEQFLTFSDLKGAGRVDFTGCSIALGSSGSGDSATPWRARGEILGYNADTKECVLEWRLLTRAAQLAGLQGSVRYRVTAPMLFRVAGADADGNDDGQDEGRDGRDDGHEAGHVTLQRLPLAIRGDVPVSGGVGTVVDKADEETFPFPGDTLRLPRAAARAISVLSTDFTARGGHPGEATQEKMFSPGKSTKKRRGGAERKVLSECEEGSVVGLHSFSLCKAFMLALTPRPARRGNRVPLLAEGQLPILLPSANEASSGSANKAGNKSSSAAGQPPEDEIEGSAG
ncbi:hypothetical protein T484DRAFT_1795567, partial [Baffinella frigidus]